jgi:hypothetical protein
VIACAASSPLASGITAAVDPYASIKNQEIIQKYAEICGQPMPERVQSMQKLNAIERSYLWRVHLGLYLTQHTALSRDQQSLILDTLAVATPQLFAGPDGKDPNWKAKVLEPLENLKSRVLQLFSKEEAAQFLSNLGGDKQEGDSVRKYAALAELSKLDRKAAFAKMPSADKSALWRVHLGINLARHPEWNQEQRDLVLEAAAIVTPEIYDIPRDANWSRAVDEPIKVLTQRALIYFGKTAGAEVFAELGGKEAPANHTRRPPTPACDCSHQSDWCVWDCYSNNCTSSPLGCGTFGLYACDGICYWPPEIN